MKHGNMQGSRGESVATSLLWNMKGGTFQFLSGEVGEVGEGGQVKSWQGFWSSSCGDGQSSQHRQHRASLSRYSRSTVHGMLRSCGLQGGRNASLPWPGKSGGGPGHKHGCQSGLRRGPSECMQSVQSEVKENSGEREVRFGHKGKVGR